MKSDIHFSRKSDEWETPQDLFDKLNEEFRFTLDAASSEENKKCKYYFTKENDGLSKSWEGHTTFINPPYSQLKAWIKKAHEESKESTVVMLIPARTDTKAFHDYLYNKPNVEIRFLRGRVKFISPEMKLDPTKKANSAPFPSMIVIFRP